MFYSLLPGDNKPGHQHSKEEKTGLPNIELVNCQSVLHGVLAPSLVPDNPLQKVNLQFCELPGLLGGGYLRDLKVS